MSNIYSVFNYQYNSSPCEIFFRSAVPFVTALPLLTGSTGYSQRPFAFRFASCSCSAVAEYIQAVQSTYVSKLPTCFCRLVCTLLVALQIRISFFQMQRLLMYFLLYISSLYAIYFLCEVFTLF